MGNMSQGEMWAAVLIPLFWFTGLWRITKQLPVIIRSGLRKREQDYMILLYSAVRLNRMAGLLTAIFVGVFIYYKIPLPKLFWIWVILGSIFTLSIAGQGSRVIGVHIPLWLTLESPHYEGFGESLSRLPETFNETAKQLFEEGQEAEGARDYDAAITIYEEILAIDPGYVKCLMAKGILHCIKNELREGRKLFLATAEICPTSAYVLHLLARVEKQMGLQSDYEKHEAIAEHNLDVERAKEMLDEERSES